jgi:terminase small subunit / prophage DNA-packing protein
VRVTGSKVAFSFTSPWPGKFDPISIPTNAEEAEMASNKQTLNRSELAHLFRRSPSTIDEWVRRGCPYVTRGARGREWTFDPAAVADWREERAREAARGLRAASLDELKRRKLEAEVETAELALATAKGAVVTVDQYERALARVFGEVRAGVRNVVPGRAVRRLLGETDDTAFKLVLLEEIDQALEALADADLLTEDDLEDNDG